MIDPNRIIEITAEVYGVSVEEIMGRSRKIHIAEPRQMAMLMCYEKAKLRNFTHIGAVFGRAHTSVMHGIRKMRGLLEVGDRKTQESYKLITERL